MNSVNYLIISSSIDYSTDLICLELEKRNVNYLRINRDSFSSYNIEYNLTKKLLTIQIDGTTYVMSDDELKGIYFRAPVFLRTIKIYSLDEQLYRSQWSSFIRNLLVFEKAKWINHPVNTYRAENKLYQLKKAKEAGLIVPETYVGNTLPKNIIKEKKYIVKSLDTALFYDNGQEMFTYSTIVKGEELFLSEIKSAPVILQECIRNKTDIRVTVIGNKVFPVAISNNGAGIDEDWRKTDKANLTYSKISLPKDIENGILRLMNSLELVFGGIDLVFSDNKYYFIEVNPTGEWGWLWSTAKIPIDEVIVTALIGDEE